MEIKLDHGYFIEVDENNFTLKSKHISKKKNKEVIKIHGYYSKLENAIKNYIKLATLDITGEQIVELQELLERYKAVCDETIRLIKLYYKE